MAMKPLSTSRTRDVAGPAEPVAMIGRAVSPSKGVELPGQANATRDPQDAEGHGQQQRPREERELDEQRQALARLIVGVFEVEGESGGGEPLREADPAPTQDAATAPQPLRNPELEQAVIEFMYALFHALDQIDDAEPTLAYRVPASGSAAAGSRSAFGERLDLLASRIAAASPPAPGSSAEAAEFGLSPRLVLGYTSVLRAIHGDPALLTPASDTRPALAALLRRLANAMHVARTTGYATAATAGALLHVRA
jgi:hypothetical protein